MERRFDLIALGIRPGMVQIGQWKNDFPAIVQQCAEFCALTSSPINGWAGDMQWSVFKSTKSFRVYSGTKRFVYFEEPCKDGATLSVIYADKDFYPLVLGALCEISVSVLDQAQRVSKARQNVKTFLKARDELMNQAYPQWSNSRSKETSDDPLLMELDRRYRSEYEEVRDRTHEIMRDCLFQQSRMRGARYISVNRSFFSVVDSVRTDHLRSSPVAHQIGEDLNIIASTYGAHSFKAMNLCSLFGDSIEGVWLVNTKNPTKVDERSIDERKAKYSASWGNLTLKELLDQPIRW